jgi:rhamnopyranosyl-N-acetylglucosaminyl-diphospho-decaprenol beta-1,3/1,4-galactofuranosyltransferase
VSETVGAVVVTHNRRDLLRECLAAVLGQTRRPDHVLVVDNASDDGTASMLRDEFAGRIDVLVLAENAGSSGGFHAGFAEGVRRGFDWLWAMDDDTLPAPEALERLLAARERLAGLPEPVLLASKVVWTDRTVHPMNAPAPDPSDIDVFTTAVERGLMPIRSTTFPSLLVRRDAVERHGPPRSGFWIWADDIDFTGRILRDEPGYFVPDSVAVHKTASAHAPWEGGRRFFYAVRNGLFILRGDTLTPKEKFGWLLLVGSQIQRFFATEGVKWWAVKVVGRGLRDGVLKPRP